LDHIKFQYREKEEKLKERIPKEIREQEIKAAKSLLPLMDGLDDGIGTGEEILALAKKFSPKVFRLFSKKTSHLSPEAIESWLQGIKMMRERLLHFLKTLGVEPIPTKGQTFDPSLHCAIAVKKGPDNAILEEITRGYKTAEHVLRYAEVVVGRSELPPKEASKPQE